MSALFDKCVVRNPRALIVGESPETVGNIVWALRRNSQRERHHQCNN